VKENEECFFTGSNSSNSKRVCSSSFEEDASGTLDADEDLCSEKDVKRDISFFL
jgi:hypothetical protein